MKYAFYNYHMAEFGKRSLYLFLYALLLSAIFRTNLMWYFLIIEIVYLVYLLYRRIEIINTGNKKIHIKQVGLEDIILHLPIKAKKWWNYLPVKKSKHISSPKYEQIKNRRQNIVMSFLEITDETNQKIYFIEKIIFGTRFPNEAEYSVNAPDFNHPTFNIDRTDKLFDFIIDCTNS